MAISEHHRPTGFALVMSQARHALASALRTPLLLNGYALIASAGLTSILGLVFWGTAARLYTPEQVGLGAALISTMLTLGNISQLNLSNLLHRYLPSAGQNARRLVLVAYALAGTAAAVFSALAMFFISHLVAELSFLREEPLSGVAFVVATVAWTLFALQDSVLAGLRKATVVPLENTLFSVSKLLLLVLFAGSSLVGSGLYAAWVLPLPLLLALINWLIFFRFLPRHGVGGQTAGFDRRALARFFGWDYAGTLASMAAMGIAPLVVLHYGDASDLAVYYISWEIAYGVYLISRSMGISLLTEVALDRVKLHRLAVDALIYTTAPLAGVVAVTLVGAPLLLALLGAQYADASPAILQLLALSCLPWSVVTLMLAVARATGRTPAVAIAQIATLAIVLGLGTPLVIAHGAVGMAEAWLVAHCVVACGLLADLSLRLGPTGRLDLVLRVLSSLARLWGNVTSHVRPPAPLEASIARFCAATGLAPVDPRTVHEFRRESDVRTGVFQTTGEKAERFIFKSSVSPEGCGALARHIAGSHTLAAHADLKNLDFGFSQIVTSESSPGATSLAERAWPGEDGRTFLASSKRHFPALTRALEGIGAMHALSAVTRPIDDGWLHRWIDADADAVSGARSLLMDEAGRTQALTTFRDRQRRFWTGRSLPLGFGHGDFGPGNLLFDAGEDAMDLRLTAIIDWEALSSDAPPGLDAMFLLLTARALRSGEELGFVIRQMLEDPTLSQDEERALAPLRASADEAYGAFTDPATIRALCGLAWWRHVATNLTKSASFAEKALWVAINVDLVLAWYGRAAAGKPQSIAARWFRNRRNRQTAPAPALVAGPSREG